MKSAFQFFPNVFIRVEVRALYWGTRVVPLKPWQTMSLWTSLYEQQHQAVTGFGRGPML